MCGETWLELTGSDLSQRPFLEARSLEFLYSSTLWLSLLMPLPISSRAFTDTSVVNMQRDQTADETKAVSSANLDQVESHPLTVPTATGCSLFQHEPLTHAQVNPTFTATSEARDVSWPTVQADLRHEKGSDPGFSIPGSHSVGIGPAPADPTPQQARKAPISANCDKLRLCRSLVLSCPKIQMAHVCLVEKSRLDISVGGEPLRQTRESIWRRSGRNA